MNDTSRGSRWPATSYLKTLPKQRRRESEARYWARLHRWERARAAFVAAGGSLRWGVRPPEPVVAEPDDELASQFRWALRETV